MFENIRTRFVENKDILIPVACIVVTAYLVNRMVKQPTNIIIKELHIHPNNLA